MKDISVCILIANFFGYPVTLWETNDYINIGSDLLFCADADILANLCTPPGVTPICPVLHVIWDHQFTIDCVLFGKSQLVNVTDAKRTIWSFGIEDHNNLGEYLDVQ